MSEIDVSELNDKNIDNYIENSNKGTDKEYLWVKNVVSVIAIILGLVISLKSNKSQNMTELVYR